ncbi:hypothetical protein [Spirosoma luteum]|uniref:hypothetical protein n=1 Tax=Spirosoma luteum TaxID=431553 RepID=UPI00037877C0|nr:hypothetical protein [Spirosoma luteum]
MLTNSVLISLVTLLMLSAPGYGQAPKPAVNFLGIQTPIFVQKNAFRLSWSSHPAASFYKQEYLVAGDSFPKYKSMVTIDFVLTESTVDQAVDTKLRELEGLKRTNPIVQYTIVSNAATGEKIIDCLIGNNAADEQNNLVERDVFRFKAVKTKSGKRGILLFMVSNRKYGPGVTPFLTKLKTDKPLLINEVAELPLPLIQL